MLARLRNILVFLTVEQWRAIDEDMMDRPLPNRQVLGAMVMVAVALIVGAYFGNPRFINKFPAVRAWFAVQPYPSLCPRLYWAAFKTVYYFGIPALYIRFVIKDRIWDYGFKFSTNGKVWALYGLMLLVVLPLTYAVSYSPQFLATYPKYKHAGVSLGQFFAWEAAYGYQFLMLEIFFRGLALFLLARYIGSAAIFVMIIPYAMIHFAKPLPETAGSIIAGMALGTIALRTRSIYGGVMVHCAVAWCMDIFAMMRKGQLNFDG